MNLKELLRICKNLQELAKIYNCQNCFINFTNRTHEINSWVSVSVSEIEFHIGSKYSPATIEAKSQAGVELKD